MKVKVGKEIIELTVDELKEAFDDCARDIYFSDGQGLDWFNAQNRMSALRKEIRRRKINLKKFIAEIKGDILKSAGIRKKV